MDWVGVVVACILHRLVCFQSPSLVIEMLAFSLMLFVYASWVAVVAFGVFGSCVMLVRVDADEATRSLRFVRDAG